MSRKRLKIVYVVPHRLGGAIQQRVLGVSKALLSTSQVGEVLVLGVASTDPEICFEGLSYEYTESLKFGLPKHPFLKAARYLGRTKRTIKALSAMQRPDLILIYGGGAHFMGPIQAWSKRQGIAVAADMVEWYNSRDLPLGRFGPFALDNYLMMSRVAPRCDGVIAISKFLEGHFRGAGKSEVIRIPPLVESITRKNKALNPPKARVEFAYCGTPGKKDRLDLVIQSAISLDPNGETLRLTIAGPSPREVADLAGVSELPRVINAVGRLSPSLSEEVVRNADWVPLVRDVRRSSNAGFPTKVAEAMSVGTPVLTNRTSDLGELLSDGDNGLLIEVPDLQSTRATMQRALSLSSACYGSISDKAVDTADEVFNFRRYVTDLEVWLTQLYTARLNVDAKS